MSFLLLGILNSQVSPVAAGSYDLLESTTLTSSAASVTFTGLDSYTDYKHWQIRFTARSNSSAGATIYTNLNFNSDTGSNYYWHSLRGNGSTVNSFNAGSTQTYGRSGLTAGSTATANAFAASVLDILDPFETNKNTTARYLAGQGEIYLGSSVWLSTSTVTSITITEGYSSTFVSGSRFSLYGVK